MSTLRVVSVLLSAITTATTVLNGTQCSCPNNTTVLNRFGIPSAYDVTQGLTATEYTHTQPGNGNNFTRKTIVLNVLISFFYHFGF